jgi:hypothetical protein
LRRSFGVSCGAVRCCTTLLYRSSTTRTNAYASSARSLGYEPQVTRLMCVGRSHEKCCELAVAASRSRTVSYGQSCTGVSWLQLWLHQGQALGIRGAAARKVILRL